MPDDIPFYKTAMGREFFDRSVPSLIRELRRLNENLEKFTKPPEPKEKKKDEPG